MRIIVIIWNGAGALNASNRSFALGHRKQFFLNLIANFAFCVDCNQYYHYCCCCNESQIEHVYQFQFEFQREFTRSPIAIKNRLYMVCCVPLTQNSIQKKHRQTNKRPVQMSTIQHSINQFYRVLTLNCLHQNEIPNFKYIIYLRYTIKRETHEQHSECGTPAMKTKLDQFINCVIQINVLFILVCGARAYFYAQTH